MRAVRDGPAADDMKSAVHGQMLALTQKIAEARAERVAIVSNHVAQFGWTALFLLGFITQFGLGMAHLDRGGQRPAIAFFSCGAVVALWLIAIQDNPFRGSRRGFAGADREGDRHGAGGVAQPKGPPAAGRAANTETRSRSGARRCPSRR